MVYARDGENCVLVPHDAQSFVDACLGLVDDIDLMTKLQGGGFETVEQWPWDPVIDKLEEIYGTS